MFNTFVAGTALLAIAGLALGAGLLGLFHRTSRGPLVLPRSAQSGGHGGRHPWVDSRGRLLKQTTRPVYRGR